MKELLNWTLILLICGILIFLGGPMIFIIGERALEIWIEYFHKIF